MRKFSKILLLFAFLAGSSLVLNLTGCKHDDQILDEYQPSGSTYSETEVASIFGTPVVDATIESAWDKAIPLVTRTVVPAQLGPDNVPANFYGYGGKSYNVSIKSMYDNENIYFLVQWTDNTYSVDRETWYFDPAVKRWKQESRYPTFNSEGVMTRDAFYEDKFAFLWNVENSVANWNTSTCYATCHTGLSAADGYSRHYTNGSNERIDMWHWKLVREGVWGTVDDQYQDNATPNGRKSDPKVSGTGYSDNKQELTITGSTDKVNVPKYIIPGRKYYYWITKDEVNTNVALLVTAVDDQGVLTLSDNSTINPNTDTDYHRDGSRSGKKGVPSIVSSRTEGNGGDITGEWVFTGSGYVMEIKRKLRTEDTQRVDVDFSDLKDQYFGIGLFENAALAHAIKANLKLTFKK
jgi:hypothetical protein